MESSGMIDRILTGVSTPETNIPLLVRKKYSGNNNTWAEIMIVLENVLLASGNLVGSVVKRKQRT